MPTYRLTKKGTLEENRDATSDVTYNGGDWRTVRQVWAEIKPIPMRERIASDQVYAGATHQIIIRWPGIIVTTENRFRFNSEIYPIIGVDDLGGEGQYLLCFCSQRADGRGRETTR